jgi:hypothetical protein
MRIKNYPGARIKSENIESPGKNTEGLQLILLTRQISDGEKWKLGGCPRCHGDVFLDSEAGELLGHCLQCGYVGARINTTTSSVPRLKLNN